MKKSKGTSSQSNYVLLLPAIFILLILPLIVKNHQYDPKLNSFLWFSNTTSVSDIFLYYKQWVFVAISALMLSILIVRHLILKEKLIYMKQLLPLIAYCVLIVCSFLFSRYKLYSLNGVYEQFENVFSLLGYLIVFYYILSIVNTTKHFEILTNVLAVGTLLIGIISILQALGYDVFSSLKFNKLVFGPNVTMDQIHNLSSSHQAYATLYNPNYVGSYTILTVPLFAVLSLYSKKVSLRIFYTITLTISLAALFACRSKAGIICLIFCIFLLFILSFKVFFKNWYYILFFLIIAVAVFRYFDQQNNHIYSTSIKSAFQIHKTDAPVLQGMTTEPDGLKIHYNNHHILAFINSEGNMEFTEKGKTLTYNIPQVQDDAYLIELHDAAFHDLLFIRYLNTDDGIEFAVLYNEKRWYFSYDKNEATYLYYNRCNKFSPITEAETCLFEGYESFASSRAFIWSRTLPLLKNHFFLGSGPDTFVFEYPQYDFVAFNNFGYNDSLITKPHSMYLQIGVQTGVLSLLCFIIFYLRYMMQSLRLYWNFKSKDSISCIGFATFLGTFGYMLIGFSNDSSITVAPVFWVILGIGFTINQILIKDGALE